MSWIQTHSGKRFDLLLPTPDMIDISDIAHALSNICRFNGHCREFYSVAQHSVLVSRLVPSRWALTALMHDATEAYIGDVTRPLKHLLPDYKLIEARIWAAIAAKFQIAPVLPACVKHFDNVALMTERRDLMALPPGEWSEGLEDVVPDERVIRPDFPSAACEAFLDRFTALTEDATSEPAGA
jgi:hypothetical protein